MQTIPLRVLFFAPVLGLAAHASAIELIQNGGFDTGTLDPWIHNGVMADGGNTSHDFSSASSVRSHSGPFSADFGIQNSSSTEFDQVLLQHFTPVSGADVTNVSLWAYSFDQDLNVSLIYSDNSATNLRQHFNGGEFASSDPEHGWRMWNLTANVDPTKTLTGIELESESGFIHESNDIFVDDVSVQAVPEPASVAALGFGALALLKRRRR